MTDSQWIVAAESTQVLESQAMRPGRLVASPGQRVAAGTSHAVRPGETRTACGLDVAGLHQFEIPFLERNMLDRCQRCIEIAEA